MDFQRIIMCLSEFWADQGCLLWQPYNVQVGAGTMNPATFLRVLGPEPWNVGYVEPSIRPADGRYGENPNRWQQFYQYQVILKPDPGNPQELYLESLKSLGIRPDVHDIRFVEDNWESPALGAWGLGWEVWLDGQEISQYTYFQQAGGINLDPVSVELTYGLERIAMVLQGVRTFLDIRWGDGLTYGDILLRGEVEHCTYNFETADVDNLHELYDLCEAEAENALEAGLLLPAHDYILKCSHIFNVLDARGAVGVTERANYFLRMRSLAQRVAKLMFTQREELGHPFKAAFPAQEKQTPQQHTVRQPGGAGPFDFVLEIGGEELPVDDLDSAIGQLEQNLPEMLAENRLGCESLEVSGTPRRLVAQISGLEGRQPDEERVVKGPSVAIAYDEEGQPTRAAQGFSRSRGVDVETLERRMIDGKQYVVARFVDEGEPTSAVLARMLPELVASLHFDKSMRWNESGVSHSRPIRWILALLGDTIIPFEYADVVSGRVTRGIRPQGSPQLSVTTTREYPRTIADAGIMLRVPDRETAILEQAGKLADEVDGELVDDPDLLREVANLVEYPLAIRGSFDDEYLRLPDDVLLAVMRKHQRYLPVVREGDLLSYYIAVANGQHLDVEAVRHGNQEVLRARYADAAFFYDADTRQPLEAFTSQLETLTFEEHLGSVLDKVERLKELAPSLADMLSLSEEDEMAIKRAAALCKSDLATQLVVELTSLQGKMGHHYALLSGEGEDVALAIEEHYLPRSAGDELPSEILGTVLAMADRLDTLVGLFAVGNRPTGAADPWGLRRSALGVVRLLVEKEISLDLCVALEQAMGLLPVEVDEGIVDAVLDFVATRYESYLRDRGYAHDAVQAVLGARKENPYLAYRALQELVSWIAREDWDLLLDSYARCVRITRDREQEIPQVDADLLQESASRDLYEAYQVAERRVGAEPTVKTLLDSIAEMVPAIQRFYDEVLVMVEDDGVRANRLALVKAIGDLAEGIVDLSLLEGF